MPERDPETRRARWRAPLPMRLMFWFLALLSVFVGVGLQFDEPGDPGTMLAGLTTAVSAGFCLYVVAGCVELFDDVVVIDGPLRRREIRLVEVEGVETGAYGLYFRTRDGGASGPGFMGAKGPALKLLRVRTQGDRIAEAVMSAAHDARARSDAE